MTKSLETSRFDKPTFVSLPLTGNINQQLLFHCEQAMLEMLDIHMAHHGNILLLALKNKCLKVAKLLLDGELRYHVIY